MFAFKSDSTYVWPAIYKRPGDGIVEIHKIKVRFKRVDQVTGESFFKRLGFIKPEKAVEGAESIEAVESEKIVKMTQEDLLDEVLVAILDSEGVEQAWGPETKAEVASHLGMRVVIYEAWIESYTNTVAKAKN